MSYFDDNIEPNLGKLPKLDHTNVWTTQDGTRIPLHEIETSHLLNIINYAIRHSKEIPLNIVEEYNSRT